MITSLHIRNFVIVENLELDFNRGFTAMTGQTGAGKSILIDALQLLFGARSDIELIRQGCEKSDLSATFTVSEDVKQWLTEYEFDNDEDQLIIRRTLDKSGKSRAWINGFPTTLAQLKDLSRYLVVVHGQHAHQSLLRKGAQMEMLDGYAKLHDQVQAVNTAWTVWSAAKDKLNKARSEQTANQQELERIRWFLEDMDDLSPQKGEWQAINEEHTRLSRYTDILQSCQGARQALTEDDTNALGLIDSALSYLEDVSDTDPKLEKIYNALNDARDIIETVSDDTEHYLSRTDFDEDRFNELDERLSNYINLARKYHSEPEDLFEKTKQAKLREEEIAELGDLTALEEKAHAAKAAYEKAAEQLSKARKKGATTMERQITKAMQTLAMEGGSFEIELTRLEKPSSTGIDACEFLVAGHAGVSRRPLSKVASGGELARISLAVAVTDSATAAVDTLIFDEVDTGIGGAVAETVGQLLGELGKHQQVLCITHLPQVASCAADQMKIEKIQVGPDTPPHSTVHLLTTEERVAEIARMLGGIKITEKTLEHAREMLKLA